MFDKKIFRKLLYLLREQAKKDRLISEHLNAIMFESTPSVYTTQLIEDIVEKLLITTKDDPLVWDYICEENDKKAKNYLEMLVEEYEENVKEYEHSVNSSEFKRETEEIQKK